MRARRSLLALAAGALFAVIWPVAHHAQPPLAGGDVYTHLSVARHLLQGDGYLNDVVYPLSLAYPFARAVPQPLVHRPPAYATVLTLPLLAVGRDPARATGAVRRLLALALAATAALGVAACLHAGRATAMAPWLLVLLAHPLLALLIDWGREEILATTLLLALWLQLRGIAAQGPPRSAALVIGGLAAALLLLRPELGWLPLFWWLTLPRTKATGPAVRIAGRRLALAAAVCLLLCLPWLVRTAQLTGDPLFTLQAHAEHWKWTPTWPWYTVYQQLESPPGILSAFWQEPRLMFGKTAIGAAELLSWQGQCLPWALWGVALAAAARRWRQRRRRGDSRRCAGGPASVAAASWLLVGGLYSVVSPSTRHLMPLLPVLLLEICWLLQAAAKDLSWPPAARAAAPALVVAATMVLTPLRLGGWAPLVDEARVQVATTAGAVAELATLPPGPIFTDAAAVVWHSGRAGVWEPLDAATENWIRANVPGMGRAVWARVAAPGVVAQPERR